MANVPGESVQPCLLRQKVLSHKEGLEGATCLGLALRVVWAMSEAAPTQSLMLRGVGKE